MLIKDPKVRLGSQKGAAEIKAHPWFKSIEWERLLKKEVQPPFKPKIEGEMWVDNFDKQFTEEQAINSYAQESNLIGKDEFQEFDFAK